MEKDVQVLVDEGRNSVKLVQMSKNLAEKYKKQEKFKKDFEIYALRKDIENRLTKLCGWNTELMGRLRQVQIEHPNIHSSEARHAKVAQESSHPNSPRNTSKSSAGTKISWEGARSPNGDKSLGQGALGA